MQLVLPIAYFPPVSWMALFLHGHLPMLEIHETYPKQTIRNRCYILAANGKLRLTVPVKKANGKHTKTSAIFADFSLNWPMQHLRAIESAYRKTPYYLFYEDLLKDFFLSLPERLTDITTQSLNLLMKMLRTQGTLLFTEAFAADGHFCNLTANFDVVISTYHHQFPSYYQVFADRFGFVPDLSMLDLILHLGPAEAMLYLNTIAKGPLQELTSYSG